MRKHKNIEVERFSNPIVSSISNQSSEPGTDLITRLPSDYSPPISALGGTEGRVSSSLSCEVHLTVRSKVELSRRSVGLLLENYLIRLTYEGFDLYSYLLVDWMSSYLRGSNDSDEIKIHKERLVIRLSEVVLRSFGKSDLPLGEKFTLLPEVLSTIRDFLDPSGRLFASRRIFWQLEKFLEVRSVLVTSVFEREKNSSTRYSSYCKGYGESSRMGRRKKTAPSFELDGKTEDIKIGSEFSSLLNIQKYLHLNLLEIKLKSKKP